MEPTDLTIQILREIRDEIRGTNTRVDGLNDRVDGLNDRVDGLNDRVDGLSDRVERVERRLTETDLRLGTELLHMTSAFRDIRDLLENRLNLKDRVERCEHDIGVLKTRVGV